MTEPKANAVPASILAGISAIASYWLAAVYDAQLQAQMLAWLLIGFVVLPLLFTLALALVAATITLLVTTLAIPSLLRRRPTGLRPLLHDLWRLPAHVIPGFGAAIRKANRPLLWATLLGFAAGTTAYLCLHGFVTVAG